MNNNPNKIGKISMILSILGLAGGILVPVFGTIDNMFWGEIIDGWIDFILFVIFTVFCITAIILTLNSKKDDNFSRYSFVLSIIGLCINGFWIITGLAAALY